jgi:GH24 family phage-related lysozyme (muramidase)
MADINEAGLTLIESFEGLKLTAYRDQGGTWTIGYGHTPASAGETETATQALSNLMYDLMWAEAHVTNDIGSAPTTANQFSAMVSFTFNEGVTAFAGSSVLRNHRAGNFQAAANAFLFWVLVDGKRSNGLTRRRNAERALYLSA